MSATAKIQELVRDGKATPSQGARLIQLRREIAASRERQLRRRHPMTNVLLAMGGFLLALLGIIRRDAA